MGQQVSAIPVGGLIEEVEISLAALATRDGVTIDGKDWYGSVQEIFRDDRKSGWPFLDFTVRPPGNLNVNLQYAVPTFPIAEPPVLTFTTFLTVAVGANAWGRIRERIEARFYRVQLEDTSNAANNNIYISTLIRGN